MNEKGILFSSEMVLAILAGRKTQTRRIIKPQPQNRICYQKSGYHTGDILYVRETWVQKNGEYHYFADSTPAEKLQTKWRPSIHMPKNAARIWLRVKKVSAERIQNISEIDSMAEGASPCGIDSNSQNYRSGFVKIWLECYGDESWKMNPWVWVIEFERFNKL